MNLKLKEAVREIKIAQRENIILAPHFYEQFPEIHKKIEEILELSKKIDTIYDEILKMGEDNER